MIFWIDNTSIYDCRTFSLIKPQQYDVARILDYIKQEQQNNKIDIKEKLPKLLKTLALLLIIHNKNDIFRLLKILASKDFYYTKLYNDFMNNPAAQWYIESMKVEPVQMIMNQYIQGEYKFLESLFETIINSYQQYIQKLQNGQETLDFNQQVQLQSKQNQISNNKKKGKYQKNQQQEKQINKIKVIDVQKEKPNDQIKQSIIKVNSNQDQLRNQEQFQNQNQNQELIQQQQINKYNNIIILNDLDDKQQNQQKQNEQQQQIQGSYFSEQQKISLESIFKNDIPDQQELEVVQTQSNNVQQKQTQPSPQQESKCQSNSKTLEKKTDMFEEIINTEQNTLNEKEQQEFVFTDDTELVKLFDLLKEKCEQIYWWPNFEDKCHKAINEQELEIIMSEKLPILMNRWVKITRKNVTKLDLETKNKQIENLNTQGMITEISNIVQSQEKLYNQKFNEDNCQNIDGNNNLNYNEQNNDIINKQQQQINQQQSNYEQEQILNQKQKNEINNLNAIKQPQIHKQYEQIREGDSKFTSKLDIDSSINQNEIKELIPYQITDCNDEIFKSFQGDSKIGQLPQAIKTNTNKQYQEIQKSTQQNHSEKLLNLICHETSNDQIISNRKIQQSTMQQQTEDQIKIQNQNTVGQNQLQYINDDIDNLFEDNNNKITNPNFEVSQSSILISDQSSFQLDEIKNQQLECQGQLNQQKNMDNLNISEINIQQNHNRKQKDKGKKSIKKNEEQKSGEKQTSEEKQQSKNNKKDHKNQNCKNQKSKSQESNNNNKEKTRAKSQQQYKEKEKEREKEKNKDNQKKKSNEQISGQDILKQLKADLEIQEKQKEELKKKEKEKIHQENLKIAQQKLQRMRQEEIEYQKEYKYLDEQSKLQEMKDRELQQQQQQQQQYHQQQMIDNQSYVNQSQQVYQGHQKQMMYHKKQNNQSNSQKNQQSYQQNYNQNNRYDKNQINNNSQEKPNIHQNQQQKSNSYALPLVQYGIQEFLTKKDQTIQKNIQKSIINPVQYDLEQIQSPIIKQNNYRKKQQSEQNPLQPQFQQQKQKQQQFQQQQNLQQQQFQQQQNYQQYNPQQQQFQQQYNPQQQQNLQQQQHPQQQQFQQSQFLQQQQDIQQQQQHQFQQQQQQQFHNQKHVNKKFRNNQNLEQNFYHKKQHYQNHQDPYIKKQRKYNPYHEQNDNNQSFNYNQSPQFNMNAQPYSNQDQMNNHQINYKNPRSHPNSPMNQSYQPSKEQMFQFLCQMFFAKE